MKYPNRKYYGLGRMAAFGLALSLLPHNANAAGRAGRQDLVPACRAGKAYIDALNARDFVGLGSLYADQVHYVAPDGSVKRGREAAVEFERRGFDSMKTPWAARIVNLLNAGKNVCFVNFHVSSDGTGVFVPGAIERIETNADGKISHQIPYIAASRLAAQRARTDGGSSGQ